MEKNNYLELAVTIIIWSEIILSCNIKTHVYENDYMGNQVTSLPESPHYYDEDEQFFLILRDSIYITYGSDLHSMYKCWFANYYPDYECFKSTIERDGKRVGYSMSIFKKVDYVIFDEAFPIDRSIIQNYIENGIQSLIDRFCVLDNRKLKFINICDIPYDKRRTIAYCMWLNGYYFCYGGMTGEEYFIRQKEIKKKI